jgi:DNA (cytosine-5)-methyltransferase 1
MRINGLDLFSGIGGIALALHPWVQTVAYCEIEKYPQKVLLKNMENGNLDTAPIYPDVTTLKGKDLEHRIDIITGGFPCQDISVAGHGAGLAGERSGLFFEIVRLARELRPTFIFLENVPAITTRGGCAVVAELTKIGYDCRWTTLSAKAVGANHKRERWWLLARLQPSHARREPTRPYEGIRPESIESGLQDLTEFCSQLPNPHGSDGRVQPESPKRQATTNASGNGSPKSMANPSTKRLQENFSLQGGREQDKLVRRLDSIWSAAWWAVEPDVGRVAHGIPSRVDRIKALGNSVVPLQARVAFEYLLKGTTP